jgi:RNA-binding protein
MSITPAQKRYLRGQAHHLKPVVLLGQHGLTANVIAEIGVALDAHELIKVRINAEDRQARRALTEDITRQTGAELIQTIGHVAVFFRRNEKKPKIALPAG